MVSSVDMSLEDIIKTNNIRPGNRGGGRGRRGGPRGGGQRGGNRDSWSMGTGNRQGGNRPMSNPPRGNINGRWSHDLYQGPAYVSSGPTKLQIINLDYGVSEADVQELFSEFGTVRRAEIHYDRSGRSLGIGVVTFDRHSDAVKAQRKYDGVKLDGRAMRLTVQGGGNDGRRNMVPPVKRLSGLGPRTGGMRGNRGGRGRRGGGGGGSGDRGGKTKIPTAEELDAELDEYVNQASK